MAPAIPSAPPAGPSAAAGPAPSPVWVGGCPDEELPWPLQDFLAEARPRWAADAATGPAVSPVRPAEEATGLRYAATLRRRPWAPPGLGPDGVAAGRGRDRLHGFALPFADFRAVYRLLWPAGWRLHHVRPHRRGAATVWTASWEHSPRGELQLYATTTADLLDQCEARRRQGWRVRILAGHLEPARHLESGGHLGSGGGDRPRYTAVWEPSRVPELLACEVGPAELAERDGWLQTQGWRLAQLVVVPGPAPLHTAVWRPGTLPQERRFGLDPVEFRAEADRLAATGWRLRLLSPYPDRRTTRYAAVWSPSPVSELRLDTVEPAELRRRADRLGADGWALELVEPYQLSL